LGDTALRGKDKGPGKGVLIIGLTPLIVEVEKQEGHTVREIEAGDQVIVLIKVEAGKAEGQGAIEATLGVGLVEIEVIQEGEAIQEEEVIPENAVILTKKAIPSHV
jgi:hypothetical protein